MTENDIAIELGVLTEQIKRSRQDIAEIKTSQTSMATRSVTFEKTYISEHACVTGAIDNAHNRIDEHDIKIAEIKTELFVLTKSTRLQLKELTEAIAPLVFASRVLIWIIAAAGVSIIGLVVSLITGRVNLVFG